MSELCDDRHIAEPQAAALVTRARAARPAAAQVSHVSAQLHAQSRENAEDAKRSDACTGLGCTIYCEQMQTKRERDDVAQRLSGSSVTGFAQTRRKAQSTFIP